MSVTTIEVEVEKFIHARGVEASPDLKGRNLEHLKKEIIKPENYEKVKASWQRLCKAMEEKSNEIGAAGSSYIPEIDFSEVAKNGNTIPAEATKLYRERGCLIIRGVTTKEQAKAWRDHSKNYIKKHPEIKGSPHDGVASNWYIHWSQAQVEARSHPRIMLLMKALGKLYKSHDPNALLDMDSQVVYADRLRIRKPGRSVTLPLHLDSSSIERWEDEGYRDVYREVFEGNWENWDPNVIDRRIEGKQDLYSGFQSNGSTSSVFRAFQGWLALSDAKCGQGTIRFLPDLKMAIPYVLLRPFFWRDDGEIDVETSKFPGATPGSGQFLANNEGFFPHLNHKKSVIGIPYVKPGDFVLWHADLLHEVDQTHNGSEDSCALYIANTPLCPYNIETLLDSKEKFLKGGKPRDFTFEFRYGADEGAFEDRGNVTNILSEDGKRSVGLAKFDVDEIGLTAGQVKIRKMANLALFGAEN